MRKCFCSFRVLWHLEGSWLSASTIVHILYLKSYLGFESLILIHSKSCLVHVIKDYLKLKFKDFSVTLLQYFCLHKNSNNNFCLSNQFYFQAYPNIVNQLWSRRFSEVYLLFEYFFKATSVFT